MRQRDDFGVQAQAIAKRRRQRRREPVVAAFDAIHVARGRRDVVRELIDERDQRQLLGVGQIEAAQPDRRRAKVRVGLHLIQPRRHRSPREVGGHGGVPPALREQVRFRDRPELLRHALPAARGAARDDFRLARRVRAYVAESAPQDGHQLQPEPLRELADFLVFFVDEIAASLTVLAFREPLTPRPDAAADAVARLHDRDGGALLGEVARRRKAGEARACHQHRDVLQRVHAHTLNGNARRLR